eukprot:EG_transcript_21213
MFEIPDFPNGLLLFTTYIGAIRKEADDCRRLRLLFDILRLQYVEVDVTELQFLRKKLAQLSGTTALPQAFVGNRFLGEYDALQRLEDEGQLRAHLAKEGYEEVPNFRRIHPFTGEPLDSDGAEEAEEEEDEAEEDEDGDEEGHSVAPAGPAGPEPGPGEGGPRSGVARQGPAGGEAAGAGADEEGHRTSAEDAGDSTPVIPPPPGSSPAAHPGVPALRPLSASWPATTPAAALALDTAGSPCSAPPPPAAAFPCPLRYSPPTPEDIAAGNVRLAGLRGSGLAPLQPGATRTYTR